MSENVFQLVKSKANLAEFICNKSSDAKIKESGNTIRVNPCPFCDSKDSFSIKTDTPEVYKCFSCGSSGDIFNFLEKLDGVDRKESLTILAEQYNVDLESGKKPNKKPENQLQKVLLAAVDYYKTNLQADNDALAYLTKDKPAGRGHTNETIKKMDIGLADGNMAKTLVKNGISEVDLKRSGLYIEDKKGEWRDYFVKGLIIFPHKINSNNIAHFTVKDPNKKFEYQLKSENRLGDFHWSNQKCITQETNVLIEGENDLASCFDIGINNAMASLGSLSDKQIRWL